MIAIMNLRNTKPSKLYDARVDRNSPLGNIFYMVNEAQRDTVCEQYKEWFDYTVVQSKQLSSYTELLRLQTLYRQYGRLRLFCWCAPKRCHAETIKDWLEENKE